MNLLKNIFKKKDESINSYTQFWDWFRENEKAFFKVIKEKGDIEKEFFDKISPKLNNLKEGFFFLAGKLNESTMELILTPDGIIKNIVFVEELVKAAPPINGWVFTALKPPTNIHNMVINMGGHVFSAENMSFYANNHASFPDEIDITVVHNDLREDNRSDMSIGIMIFLDNYLGESNFVTTIDNIDIITKSEAGKELIPIEKLKDFLIWRQAEFIEKYEGTLQLTENHSFSLLEAELENQHPLIAVVDTDLLNWDSKASHPWIVVVELKYDGSDHNGMPDDKISDLLNTIEEEILEELKDFDGYLNIGRQTAESVREIYFACKDFRKPSKTLFALQKKHASQMDMDFDIYKDKYWRSFDRFLNR